MRVVASYILKSPMQAVLSALVPAVLSLIAPSLLKLLLIYFSGIVVALVTLRMGPKQGLTVLLIALIATVSVGQLLGLDDTRALDLWSSVYIWVMIWLGAGVLHQTRSLALMLEVVGLIAILTILAFFVLVDDPIQVCLQLLQPMSEVLSRPDSGLSPAEVTTFTNSVAKYMIGGFAAFTVISAVISLFIARSWQAKLFNPGGFKQEFIALRIGRQAGLLAIAIMLALMLSETIWQQTSLVLVNFSFIVVFLSVVVGLAIVHGLVAQRDNKGYWLVWVYALLIMLSTIIAPLLMTLALSDIWVDYRARFQKK